MESGFNVDADGVSRTRRAGSGALALALALASELEVALSAGVSIIFFGRKRWLAVEDHPRRAVFAERNGTRGSGMDQVS